MGSGLSHGAYSDMQLPEWRGKYADLVESGPEALFQKLHSGEPWFLLRAQDVTAPGGVEAYANTLNAQVSVLRHVIEILDVGNPDLEDTVEKLELKAEALHIQALDCFAAAEAMRQWQSRNLDKVKIPD